MMDSIYAFTQNALKRKKRLPNMYVYKEVFASLQV